MDIKGKRASGENVILFEHSMLESQHALFHGLCLFVTLGFEITSWSFVGIVSVM